MTSPDASSRSTCSGEPLSECQVSRPRGRRTGGVQPASRAALALVLCGGLAFGACAGAESPPPPGEPIVVQIWHQKDAAERDFLQDWATNYNGRQDSVEVEVLYKETEELRNHYVFAAIGEKGPDLIFGPADNMGTLGITETIRPLNDLVPQPFLDGFSEDGRVMYDGQIYGLADQIGNHLTFVYNPALLPEPPHTLEELAALGSTLTKDLDGDGDPDQYALVWNYTEPFFFVPFLTSFGGWVMDDAGNPTLDTPETVAAIQYVLDLRDRYNVIPREADYETAKALFRDDFAAATIDGPWSWGGYSDAGVDVQLAPLPLNEQTGLYARPMAAPKAYSVNPAVPGWKLPAVIGVLMMLTGDEIQTQMANELATIPVRTAVRESGVMEANPVLQQSLRQIEKSLPTPTDPQMRQIWDAMRGPYQLVMNGQVSAQEGARLMQEQAEKRIADTFLN
ncbi:extracellular solute-binding protein [Rubrivirga sp.]|uniref:extracellular solute-binding protein n=1 Tax=Rubrivirga sp. TaxID=1885344 RepID=UPI003C7754F9